VQRRGRGFRDREAMNLFGVIAFAFFAVDVVSPQSQGNSQLASMSPFPFYDNSQLPPNPNGPPEDSMDYTESMDSRDSMDPMMLMMMMIMMDGGDMSMMIPMMMMRRGLSGGTGQNMMMPMMMMMIAGRKKRKRGTKKVDADKSALASKLQYVLRSYNSQLKIIDSCTRDSNTNPDDWPEEFVACSLKDAKADHVNGICEALCILYTYDGDVCKACKEDRYFVKWLEINWGNLETNSKIVNLIE